MSRKVAAVVLAAGEGKRLKSDLPKVLHRAAGLPLLAHALSALDGLDLVSTVVVASPRRDEIAAAIDRSDVEYVVQDPPRGTADAVAVALGAIGDRADTVLVINGDVPLLEAASLEELIETHVATDSAGTLMTTHVPRASDYGRVVKTLDGTVDRIVEVSDASPEELDIKDGNAGVYVFAADRLMPALEKIDTDNVQGELYLTDVIEVLRRAGETVAAVAAPWEETRGVNDRSQLAEVTSLLHKRNALRLMAEGVGIVDPATTFIDSGVTVGRDTTILPFTFLEGGTTVGRGASVGPQCRIVDSRIGDGATVTFAVVRGSDIGPEASVGPFASLRPGTKLERGAKLGTFVESKNSSLGPNSKANHLAYLGDATIGSNVNVGAGTITCNWDGVSKHETTIEDDAYISSDTMLVAPVRIGKGAATGAGSVVREDVPDGALAVGVPARIIEGKGNRTKGSGGKS